MPSFCRAKDNGIACSGFQLIIILLHVPLMMKQAHLGRKIADLRKSKGFTQEELVEKGTFKIQSAAGEITGMYMSEWLFQ